jgi:hypothetical protein
MKTLQLIVWFISLAPTTPAIAAPEVWVGTIAAHTIACSADPVDRSDTAAVTRAGQAFFDRWPRERLVDLGAVFSTDTGIPSAILFCAQYFSDAPVPEGFALRSAPASSGLFAYCRSSETEACQTRLQELLGDTWHGERWSRLRFDWMKPGSEPPATIPARAELERLAVARQPRLSLPDADSELQPVGQLIIARLTQEDTDRIRGRLTRPSATPDPIQPFEQPPTGEPTSSPPGPPAAPPPGREQLRLDRWHTSG